MFCDGIRADPGQFGAIIEDFKARRWVSFRRLTLHLCRVFDDEGIAEACTQFRDLEILEHPSTQHEAVLLLETVFARLPDTVRVGILEWIERGPDQEAVRDWLGEKGTEQEVDDYCDRWRRDRLALLKAGLQEPWAAKLAALINRFGPARPLETEIQSHSWSGPTSPKTSEELHNMSIQEVVDYLRNWQPPQGPMDVTPEGLGRTLAGVVATRVRPHQFGGRDHLHSD